MDSQDIWEGKWWEWIVWVLTTQKMGLTTNFWKIHKIIAKLFIMWKKWSRIHLGPFSERIEIFLLHKWSFYRHFETKTFWKENLSENHSNLTQAANICIMDWFVPLRIFNAPSVEPFPFFKNRSIKYVENQISCWKFHLKKINLNYKLYRLFETLWLFFVRFFYVNLLETWAKWVDWWFAAHFALMYLWHISTTMEHGTYFNTFIKQNALCESVIKQKWQNINNYK